MKCLYHADADGKCAAYWVSRRFIDQNPNDFIMMDYGTNIDWFSKISKDEKVIIVDYSIEPEDMKRLLNKTKDVTWIDHHITSIDKYKDFESEIPGLRYNGIAGCMLTYCYYFEMNSGKDEFNTNMTSKAPWMTKYIADRDVWAYEFGDNTTFFNLGLDAIENLDPTSKIWNDLLSTKNVSSLIENGRIIQKYKTALGNRAVDQYAFEYEIEGVKALCLNNVFGGSEWMGEAINKYDMICVFHMNKDGLFEYSLYSEKIDTSKISKKYKGGGHPGASGFVTDKLIFKF